MLQKYIPQHRINLTSNPATQRERRTRGGKQFFRRGESVRPAHPPPGRTPFSPSPTANLVDAERSCAREPCGPDSMASSAEKSSIGNSSTRVLGATSAMLAFISFWRVAAIVLHDMGSSAFYAGAISEHFVGKTAPWFVLAIMLLAGTVAALYIESCGMFVRGGVFRVVKKAMGSTLAKFSVSALMFDYILTGPISGVSAGLYLMGLLNELLQHSHMRTLPVNAAAAVFAIFVTLYFWWENVKGIPESSE